MNKNISFASFNLYNLQVPGKTWRYKKYSQAEYDAKIEWSAQMVQRLDADVIAFQELWSKQCLEDIFIKAGLAGEYELVFIKDSWYDIAVAAAIRKPWKLNVKEVIKDFPEEFILKKRKSHANASGEDDELEVKIDRFSRSLLKLKIVHDKDAQLGFTLFCSHLKSKLPSNLDKEEYSNDAIKAHSQALGMAVSTIRRTAESVAVRIILSKEMKGNNEPVVLIGDLNDGQFSNTLSIITEQPPFRLFQASKVAGSNDKGMYSTLMLQQYRSIQNVYFTHEFQGVPECLDHILVSEQFYDHSKDRIWSFQEMKVYNDHVEGGNPATSDHGQVCARFVYDKA